VSYHIWGIAVYGAESWALRKVDQQYLESVEMWCLRTISKISWTDRVRSEKVLQRMKEEWNNLQKIQIRKDN